MLGSRRAARISFPAFWEMLRTISPDWSLSAPVSARIWSPPTLLTMMTAAAPLAKALQVEQFGKKGEEQGWYDVTLSDGRHYVT